MDLSSLVLINNPLSSNNSNDLTISVCPSKLATNDPDFHSHIFIVLSNDAEAIKSLSIVYNKIRMIKNFNTPNKTLMRTHSSSYFLVSNINNKYFSFKITYCCFICWDSTNSIDKTWIINLYRYKNDYLHFHFSWINIQ